MLVPNPLTCKPVPASCVPALREGAILRRWAATVSDPHFMLATWTGPSPCSVDAPYTGVKCDTTGRRVVGLDLAGNDLGGTLEGLELLEHLEVRAHQCA